MSGEESTLHLFYLAQTSSGAWLVRDRSGAHVGIFRSRAHALRYVRDELGAHERERLVDLGQCTLERFIAA